MAGTCAGISRRDLMASTIAAAATAAVGTLPSFAAAAAPAEVRFRFVKLHKSSTAGYLQELRRNRSSFSQLVLESEGYCLVLAGERSHTGARRLEL
jgi:hypothetical protein